MQSTSCHIRHITTTPSALQGMPAQSLPTLWGMCHTQAQGCTTGTALSRTR